MKGLARAILSMNPLLIIAISILITTHLRAQDPRTGAGMHTETSFDITVAQSLPLATVLFTPEGERAWAGPGWDPHYVYASGEGRDGEGAVFTTRHGEHELTWVVTKRDMDARHFQYVYFIPHVLVTTVDVRFSVLGEGSTRVHVTYARTAATAEGEEAVRSLTEGDQKAADEWQKSIDAYLKSQRK